MTRLFVAALALVLLVVPSAVAKPDLTVVRVCGPSACSETRDQAVLEALRRLFDPPSSSITGAPAIGPYFVIRGGGTDEPYGTLVPGRTSLRWGWSGGAQPWIRGAEDLHAALERLAARVPPFMPARPIRAIVDGRRAANPARFVRLLGDLEPRSRPRATGPVWIPVTLIWDRPNPWTDASSMFFDPDDRALFRGGAWYRVPQDLVRMITRR